MRQTTGPSVACHRYFTSNLRTADNAPVFPAASLGRTRDHSRRVGSVLLVYWDAVIVWLIMSGAVKVSASSISMV